MSTHLVSKKFKTGRGVVTAKFYDDKTVFQLPTNLNPDLYDWEQIGNIFTEAIAQACIAGKHGKDSYWDV